MRKLKDIHIQVTEAQHTRLKEIAAERGILAVTTMVRSVLIEHFDLPKGEKTAVVQEKN